MSKFPVLFAGQRFTATLAGQMEPDYYVKNSNTSRASTTTATDDPDLIIPVLAGEVCLCEFYVKYLSPAITTPPLLKSQWGLPTGTSANRNVQGAGSTSNDSGGDNMTTHWGVHGNTTGESYGWRSTTGASLWLYEWSVVTVGATAGNVSFQWAQSASNTNAVQVTAGSFARHTRLS